MATVVTVDKAGRIVIPKEMRDAQGIEAGAQFLLVEGEEGLLWLQRLKPEDIARRLREELRGVPIDRIVRQVEKEANRIARARYPVLARH